jgi:hypothetical protein
VLDGVTGDAAYLREPLGSKWPLGGEAAKRMEYGGVAVTRRMLPEQRLMR